MNRPRSQSGQSTIEFGGTLAWLLIAALFAWELALVGWTAVSASNTARSVARLYSREENEAQARQQGYAWLKDDGLGTGANVHFDGTTWTVTAKIPIVWPGFVLPGHATLAVTQTAAIPTTG